jgi:hypothetical protein
MNKRSDGRRRKSKRRSKRSKRCKSLLGKKIGINIHEGIYANKAQAIAVAYSQVRKRHPSCRRILGKKRRSKRKIMVDGAQIVGTGDNGLLNDAEQQNFQNIFLDDKAKLFNSITIKKNAESSAGAVGIDNYESIYIHKHYNFINNNIYVLHLHNGEDIIRFFKNQIMNYDLSDIQPSGAGATNEDV